MIGYWLDDHWIGWHINKILSVVWYFTKSFKMCSVTKAHEEKITFLYRFEFDNELKVTIDTCRVLSDGLS